MRLDVMRRLGKTLAVLCMVSTLAACGLRSGNADVDRSEPTPRPDSSASESPPSLPEMPEQALKKTVDGGVSFVAHYYKLVEYGHITGDWRALQELTDRACEECRKFWSRPELFEANEDVRTEVGSPHSGGITRDEMAVNSVIDVGVGLADAKSEVELYQRTTKTWQDDVYITYEDGWHVTEIDPDQLLPRQGCIADRCREYQKQ